MTYKEFVKKSKEIDEQLKENLAQAEPYQKPTLIWQAEAKQARLNEEYRSNRED